MWGSAVSLSQAVAAADMALGLMTVVNVVAIVLLTPTLVSVSQDYLVKLKQGKTISFRKSDCTIQGSDQGSENSQKNISVWDLSLIHI